VTDCSTAPGRYFARTREDVAICLRFRKIQSIVICSTEFSNCRDYVSTSDKNLHARTPFLRLFFIRIFRASYCRPTEQVERNNFLEKYKSPRMREDDDITLFWRREEKRDARSRAVRRNSYFMSIAIKAYCYITAGAVINHSRGEAISHSGDRICLAWRLLYRVAREYIYPSAQNFAVRSV